jgi:hypothetical protein
MDAGYGYVGTFCNGKLIDITLFVRGTPGNFVDVLQDLGRVYGRPTTVDMSSEMLADGRYRWLKLDFGPRPDDKVNVVLRTIPGSETAFRVSITHETGKVCSNPQGNR